MEEISSEKDVTIALNKFYDLGVIDDGQKEEYEKNILAIINHSDLNKYYDLFSSKLPTNCSKSFASLKFL